jgi:hypothetical protein
MEAVVAVKKARSNPIDQINKPLIFQQESQRNSPILMPGLTGNPGFW